MADGVQQQSGFTQCSQTHRRSFEFPSLCFEIHRQTDVLLKRRLVELFYDSTENRCEDLQDGFKKVFFRTILIGL